MSQQSKTSTFTDPIRSGDSAGFQRSQKENNGALRKLMEDSVIETPNTAAGAFADGFKQFTAGLVGGKPDQASFIVKNAETGATQIDFALAPCPYTESIKAKADSILAIKEPKTEQKQV